MNRRRFLKSILAAGVAPYVVTTAGVLMPVHALAVPSRHFVIPTSRADAERIGTEYVRIVGGGAALIREYSVDGQFWMYSPWLPTEEVNRLMGELNVGSGRFTLVS